MEKRYYLSLAGAAANAALLLVTVELLQFGYWGISAAVLLSIISGAVWTAISVRWYEQSIIDDGTGLFNRRYLFRKLEHVFRTTRGGNVPIALAVIDIDDFRSFNTQAGHIGGDLVLKEVAQTLRKTVRKGDTIGRWGGEEFAIILSDLDENGAKEVGERIRKNIQQITLPLDQTVHLTITVSIGIAVDHGRCTNMLELVNQADQAMYTAKQRKNYVYMTSTA
ncbi:GGDEF domain-containing protein [Paenibacillus allorhizosphaerae]|uniref:GGDEF domain-containing protein n=1 Tax=Paenibacillus allorhizosphaerae TaxID=2849866 RepID=A0ABN7TGQ5_9BACL|nr:GGDEF domain-containing protein [Paenibacillus allorhizosphaerae]CAG7630274.1 hypothetical protein PAECIP111802_01619 [Paenibacillus allorhizosphaerae]